MLQKGYPYVPQVRLLLVSSYARIFKAMLLTTKSYLLYCFHPPRQMGLTEYCTAVQGNFMDLKFEDHSFDAAYAIEATCHADKVSSLKVL